LALSAGRRRSWSTATAEATDGRLPIIEQTFKFYGEELVGAGWKPVTAAAGRAGGDGRLDIEVALHHGLSGAGGVDWVDCLERLDEVALGRRDSELAAEPMTVTSATPFKSLPERRGQVGVPEKLQAGDAHATVTF
jgi:hypothetical protein